MPRIRPAPSLARSLATERGALLRGALGGERQRHPTSLTAAAATRRRSWAARPPVQPAISPDGRWLAFVSQESGRGEVYLTALSAARTASARSRREPGRCPTAAVGGARGHALLPHTLGALAPGRRSAPALGVGAARPAAREDPGCSPVARTSYDLAPDGTVPDRRCRARAPSAPRSWPSSPTGRRSSGARRGGEIGGSFRLIRS